MREASAFARGVLLWLVPFAIVAAILGFEADWGRDAGPDRAPAPAVSPQPVAVALLPEYRIDGGLEARKETVDRVLFNPTRRPAPAATSSATTASSMKRGQYTLTGTTMVGSVATAFLKEVNGGKSRSVRKGETIDGMLVADVAPDHVRLKQGDDFEDLTLKVAVGPRTTVQTVVAPPAGAAGQPAGAAQPGVAGVPPRPVGGTAGGTPVRPQPGTAPPPAPAAPPASTTPRAAGSTSVSELLRQRREAARAAAEAAGAGRGNAAGSQR